MSVIKHYFNVNEHKLFTIKYDFITGLGITRNYSEYSVEYDYIKLNNFMIPVE